jgi:hypothetical protein
VVVVNGSSGRPEPQLPVLHEDSEGRSGEGAKREAGAKDESPVPRVGSTRDPRMGETGGERRVGEGGVEREKVGPGRPACGGGGEGDRRRCEANEGEDEVSSSDDSDVIESERLVSSSSSSKAA